MATQGFANYLTDTIVAGASTGTLLGGIQPNSIVLSDYHTALQNAYYSGNSQQWQLGYSPSTNLYQYYQTPQPQNRNLPILERLRSEIKDWHGEVLKV